MIIRKRFYAVTPCFAVLAAILAILPAILPGCRYNGGFAGPGSAQEEYVMGTYCSIDLFEDGNPALYSMLFTRLAELEMIFSASRDDSELSKVNNGAGLRAVEISGELFTVLERSLYFAETTGGAFDPTVGPLVKLWGIGTNSARIPSEGEINAALNLVDYRDLELTPGTAFLKRQGMALDLGAIAKGFAADELAGMLREAEVKRAIINLGGNVYVWGSKDRGEPWLIGVQDPGGIRGDYIGVLELEGSISVVCSGAYERFFIGSDGKHYHHILELMEDGKGPRGYPVENSPLSVTVIAPSSMDADALSTSCFSLGYDKGLALAAANGAEVLFIEESGIRGSPQAMAIFTY